MRIKVRSKWERSLSTLLRRPGCPAPMAEMGGVRPFDNRILNGRCPPNGDLRGRAPNVGFESLASFEKSGHIGAMLKSFASDGVHIAYIDAPPEGVDRGEPILLIHGFASNHRINWVNPRWVQTMTRAGRRVVGSRSATGSLVACALRPVSRRG